MQNALHAENVDSTNRTLCSVDLYQKTVSGTQTGLTYCSILSVDSYVCLSVSMDGGVFLLGHTHRYIVPKSVMQTSKCIQFIIGKTVKLLRIYIVASRKNLDSVINDNLVATFRELANIFFMESYITFL